MTTVLDRPSRASRPAPASRPPVRPPARQGDAWSVVSTTSLMVCLLAGWMLLQLLHLGALSHDRAQAELYDRFRAELAAGTAPIGPVTEVGAPVALLSIPRLGMQEVVTEGTASGDLLDGPGHLRNTVLPGQRGTSAVLGRASTYGAPFADLGRLAPGDRIEVTTAQGVTPFEVIGVRRAGDPLPQPRPEQAARLVLVSGESSGSRLPALSPDGVVYVDAEAEEALPTPPGLPRAVPEAEQAMGTETAAALPLLTLCLGALLALALGGVAARQRFRAGLVWVVWVPLLVAAAWVTTDVAMRLLPNLL